MTYFPFLIQRIMNNNSIKNKRILTGGAMVLAVTASVYAQEKPFMQAGTAQPPPSSLLKMAATTNAVPAATSASTNAFASSITVPIDKFFNGKIPNALSDGKFNLNVRLRYEQANEEGVNSIAKNSYAPTIRTRFGYTTAELYGFQGMVEGVNISAIGPGSQCHNATPAPNHQADRPGVVADPQITRVDQVWFGYSYTNYFTGKVGEQRIVLDNQRFIGDVGWRQNMQTYDAVAAGSEPIKDLNLYYGYIWDVHRPFGNVGGLAAANTDFDSRSHLINLSYSGWKYGRFVGYTYLLDLQNCRWRMPVLRRVTAVTFARAAPLGDRVAL